MAKFFKDWYDKSYDYGYTPAYSTGKKFTYAQCHPRGNNLIGKVGRGGLYTSAMNPNSSLETAGVSVSPAATGVCSVWERPAYEVIALDCEITSYAPDGDGPLF